MRTKVLPFLDRDTPELDSILSSTSPNALARFKSQSWDKVTSPADGIFTTYYQGTRLTIWDLRVDPGFEFVFQGTALFNDRKVRVTQAEIISGQATSDLLSQKTEPEPDQRHLFPQKKKAVRDSQVTVYQTSAIATYLERRPSDISKNLWLSRAIERQIFLSQTNPSGLSLLEKETFRTLVDSVLEASRARTLAPSVYSNLDSTFASVLLNATSFAIEVVAKVKKLSLPSFFSLLDEIGR